MHDISVRRALGFETLRISSLKHTETAEALMEHTRRHLLSLAIGGVAALTLIPDTGHAMTAKVYSEGGIAIDGTDPVAYFTQSKPVAGKSNITHDWNGVTWRFSTPENRDSFAADPARYAPQFGGYCSWAVSQGYTASTTPEAWRIVDGKLYLNYSRRIQRRWERDIPGHIAAGKANWPKVLK